MSSHPESRSNPVAAIAKGIVKFGVGIGIIAYLLHSNWQGIASREWDELRWGYIAAGFVVSTAAVLATFVRWHLLIEAQNLDFRLRDTIRAGFIGYFFNLVLPAGSVGGDLVKAVLVARRQEKKTVAIATVIVDRIVGLFGLILLGALVVTLFWTRLSAYPQLRELALWTGGVLAVACVGLTLLFARRFLSSPIAGWLTRLPVVGPTVGEAVGALNVYAEKKRVIVATLLMSVCSHIGFLFALRCTQLAMPYQPLELSVHFMVTALGNMVGAIPLTPGGLGLAEGAMGKLFEWTGNSPELAVLMMLVYRAIQVVTALLGMVYYLMSRRETQAALMEQNRATESPRSEAVGFQP